MENNIDKIVFLDFDHVLTNTDLDNTSFLHLDPSKYRLSSINLRWLDKVLAKTRAKIIIASNWRKFTPPNTSWMYEGKSYNSILEPFKKMYGEWIAGMLPPERHATKSECLELWFEDNPWFSKQLGKYAIFEDDLEEGYQENPLFLKHLILTDRRYGMTEEDADKAIALLS